MIEIINRYNQLTEYRGLSTDEKPKNEFISNGAVFIEMDINKIFLYDKENKN